MRYVCQGKAVLMGDLLDFLTEAERRHMQGIEAQIPRSERRALEVYTRGTIWWNGDAGVDVMKRPGCLRS